MAPLKGWRLLRKLRCSTKRITDAVKAVLMTTARHAPTAQASDAAIDTACRLLRLRLRLPTLRAQAADMIARAEREVLSCAGFLAELLMAECEDRDRRRAERRIRVAHFPREKSLREFDYSVNPNVDPAAIHNLATCEWITKGYPLCLIGDSGTGKSRLRHPHRNRNQVLPLGPHQGPQEQRSKVGLHGPTTLRRCVDPAGENVWPPEEACGTLRLRGRHRRHHHHDLRRTSRTNREGL